MDWDAYFGGAPTQSVVPQAAGINWDNYFGGEAMDMATDPPEQAAPAPSGPAYHPGMQMDFSRQPPQEDQSLGGVAGKAISDPLGELGSQFERVYAKYGGNPAWGARLRRDMRDLPLSTGPLGAIELGATGVARPSQKPLATSEGMPRASIRTEKDLFERGGAHMNEAKLSQATAAPEQLLPPVEGLKARLEQQAITSEVIAAHPDAARFMNRLNAFVSGGPKDRMSPMTHTAPTPPKPRSMAELHVLRTEADDVIANGKRPDGRLGTQGKIGMEFKTTVDEMIDAHPDAPRLKQGMNEWSRGEKSRIISDAMERAKNSRAWANGNEAAAIQSALRPLLDAKKYKNTWHPEERKVLQGITRRKLGNMASTFGSTSMAGLAFGRIVESMTGLPPGALLFVGVPARAMRNKSIAGRVERFGEGIRAGGSVAPGRIERLTKVLSPKVLEHITKNPRGAELVRRYTTGPDAQTARALATFVANEVRQPELARRIFAEIQGTDESQADQ
jgi:hypothetical protein